MFIHFPRWICDPYLQSETLAEAQSHQLIASFALRKISCAAVGPPGFMSRQKKGNILLNLLILSDIQQLGSCYVYIYIYIYLHILLLYVTVSKPGNLFESMADMWWWGRISAQLPLPGAFVLPNHQGQSSRHGLANYPEPVSSCPQVVGGFILPLSTYEGWDSMRINHI